MLCQKNRVQLRTVGSFLLAGRWISENFFFVSRQADNVQKETSVCIQARNNILKKKFIVALKFQGES